MAESIDFIFEGGAETLKIISRGDPLVASLAIPSASCPLIGSTIKLGKAVGKGQFGEVFVIEVPGKGTKQYVVKAGDVELRDAPAFDYDIIVKNIGVDVFNAFNPDFTTSSTRIVYPEFGNMCISESVTRYTNQTTGKKDDVVVPVGSYLCETNVYSEFFIGAMVGEAYRKNECIHFFDVYSMVTCPTSKNDTYKQYIFMDKIDDELNGIITCIRADKYIESYPDNPYEVFDSLYIQMMFAIAFYQEKYQLSHNDLHMGNLFVEFVRDTTEFNGQKLIDTEWYHYRFEEEDIDLYIPATPVLAKIGDYGLSVKYSHPIVGDEAVFYSGYDQLDGIGPWIPNTFTPAYDAMYATFKYMYATNTYQDHLFVPRCFDYLSAGEGDYHKLIAPVRKTGTKVSTNMINLSNHRPKLKLIDRCKTAKELLLSPLLSKYGHKPTVGRIVTIGVL